MLEQICRTCLATCGELVSIFSDEYYVHDLPDKLLHTTKIEVRRDDDLPKKMCKKCIFLVDSLYCFKDQCEMAEIKLKKTLTNKSVENDIITSNNVTCFDERSYDSYNIEEADIHSDGMTSSEDEYHIEYVSEEARLEVENARRRSRTKKKNNKLSSLKVKSVEILPSESKNFKDIISASKYKASEIDDNLIKSDIEKNLFTSQGLSNVTCNVLNRRDHKKASTSEKINFFKNQKHETFEKSSSQVKAGFKRKLENSDNTDELSKVPKKVMFKENDYNDENIQFIEVSENEIGKTNENVDFKADDVVLNNVVNLNETEKVFQNNDILDGNIITDHTSDKVTSSMPNLEPYENPIDNDIEKTVELRMQNLVKQLVVTFPEICTICSQSFETYLDVLKHRIETHQNSDEDHCFCPICNEKFFSNYNLIQHLNEHKDIFSYACILCFGNFYTEETLRDHLHTHVDLRELRCHDCSKKFIRIQTLVNHLDQHIITKQLICTLCGESHFKNRNGLQNHIDEDHRIFSQELQLTCETCGLEVAQDDIKEHMKSHVNYPCPYCDNIFTTKNILRDHVLTHLGVQQFSCLVCNKTFATQDERTHHMQEHMKPPQKSEQKKFRCRVCHEILLSRVAYGQHLKEKHWSAKQTSEILQELSESCLNEKVNEQITKNISTPELTS